MNIIFLCRHNLFRSRTAEEYFNKINRNPEIKVSSAGLIPDINGDCSKAERKALKEIGLSFEPNPKGINVNLLKEQDLIIVVAGDIPKGLLDNKDYINEIVYWGIPDVLDNNLTKARQIVKSIIKKCDDLNEKLSARKEAKVPCL